MQPIPRLSRMAQDVIMREIRGREGPFLKQTESATAERNLDCAMELRPLLGLQLCEGGSFCSGNWSRKDR
jgi:hypothetical protein